MHIPIATYEKLSAQVTNLSEPVVTVAKPQPVTIATNDGRRSSGVSSVSSSGSNDSAYDSDRRRKLLKRLNFLAVFEKNYKFLKTLVF